MQDALVADRHVRKPLVGETRVNTLERNRIQAIEDEHKYETLDHGARPLQVSEDEGVCCTGIKSKISKKAKELVRPYQKGDHPRDRPPIPAKPPRPSLQKNSRPNSNEGISDQESNYKENLNLVEQIKAAAQAAGYEPIDTSRSVVPPIPGVPTKGRLTRRDPLVRQSVTLEDMEQGTEFKPVLASQTSIELKGVVTKKLNAENETPKLHIDVKVTKDKKKGYENVKAAKGSLVAEPSRGEEKRGLIKRVKSIKVENPFRRTDAEDDFGESSDKPKSGLKNIFKKKDKEDFEDDLDEHEKPTLSTKIGKVFHRDKKDRRGSEDTDAPHEEKLRISERFGKIFKNEPKGTEQDNASVDCDDAKKPSLMSKFFSRDPRENEDKEIDEGEKRSFMSKMFYKDPKDAGDDLDDASDKKPSLMSRVFSRDARDDEPEHSQERKTFSEKMSEIKGKVFNKKEKADDEVENGVKEPSEKKSLFEKYFPPEKPMIQQFVLTEEMEPDLKKRRMGKITSFQQTKEVEGDVDSPAKKLLKDNMEKIATKVKEVQDMMPKTFISTKERDSELEKPDYEITTQVTVRRTPSPCRFEGRTKAVSESSNLCEREDLQITPVPAEGTEKITTDKSTVFYAKIGDSEIEVKEDHYGRIQVGDKKDPIYAKPFKMLKRSLTDLSRSTPSLPTRQEEPIEYIDVTEFSQEPREESLSHHYEQLGEPGKKKKSVSKFKVRGGHGSPKIIKVETELVKGKSLSALNEPATISVVKTVEKQKPPVPPRPRTITPTIIGKPPSSPTTPTSSIAESCSTAPFPRAPGESVSPSSTRATTPLSMLGEWTKKKIAPPRPPPPKISTVTTKVTPTEIRTTTVSSESKPQKTTLKKAPKPCRPPPPKVSVTKTVRRTPVSADKYSVYCQTDVGLSTDLLAKIERVVSSTYDESPYKPPRSRSTSKSVDNVGAASTSSYGPRSYDAVFYDEPVRLRKAGHGQETELSKRISTLQIVEEEEPPPLPPRGIRRCKSESDIDSSDSICYDCLDPDDMRFVRWAKEDDVRFYDRVTDESQSNSVSQSTPPPSASPSETNLQDLVQPTLPKSSTAKDPSLDSDSDWSDQPVQKPSPSILLKKKPLSARTARDLGGSSTDTDSQMSPQIAQPRKRHFKRSPVHSTVDPKIPEGFKRYQASDSGEDTDDLLKRAQEVQDQLRQLLSYRTEQLRVCLEADMSSSTDPEPEPGTRGAAQQSYPGDDGRGDVVSSDSEEEKELTPPPLDPREKALRHAANVAREMASSEAAFVDALKLIVEDFKGAINSGREERGDILIPNEVLDPILLYLPELLKFSSDLLENLNARVARYDEDKVIADVFVKIGQFLKLYAHYIKDYEARCTYLEDARKKYPEFNHIVQQFEASPRCNKLSVIQYMLKPVQRIPQYRLLLDDYFKHLPEDHPDRTSAQQGLHIVSAVADHADQTMKQGESHAEMVRLQNSLVSTRFNVFKPGRMLIKKGNLLKHNRKTPQWKHVVLFSDCLTYMTQVQSSLNTLKLNQELPFDHLTVKADESYPNEFSVLTQKKSFTLIAQNTEERQEWIDAIQQAVDVYHQKRLTFAVNSDGADEKEDSEVNHAPVWTPDSRVTMCQICRVSFTTFRRRHHCRNCGIVVCGVCSKREAWLPYNGGAYERVCDTCAVKLPRERLKSTAGLPVITPGSPEANKGNILFELGSNDDGCTMSGYLKMFKRGSWKRYWYVLKERVLYVYKASKDVAPVDQMVVLGFEVVDIEDAKKNDQLDLCFKLRHQGLDDMVLCADDANTAAEWKQKIRSATQI